MPPVMVWYTSMSSTLLSTPLRQSEKMEARDWERRRRGPEGVWGRKMLSSPASSSCCFLSGRGEAVRGPLPSLHVRVIERRGRERPELWREVRAEVEPRGVILGVWRGVSLGVSRGVFLVTEIRGKERCWMPKGETR